MQQTRNDIEDRLEDARDSRERLQREIDGMRAELKKFAHEMNVPSASHLQLRCWVVEWHKRVEAMLGTQP